MLCDDATSSFTPRFLVLLQYIVGQANHMLALEVLEQLQRCTSACGCQYIPKSMNVQI